MQSLVTRSAWILTFLFFANVGFAAERKDLSNVPAKIEVTGTSTTVNNQHGIKITVELRNPNNRPVAAPSPIEIELQIKAGSGTAENSKITVEQGATSATTELPVNAAGVVEVMATNPRLFEGGTLVEVRKSGERPAAVAPPPVAAAPPGVEDLSPPVMTGAAGPNAEPKRHERRTAPAPRSPAANEHPAATPSAAASTGSLAVAAIPNPNSATTPVETALAPAASPVSPGSWKPVFKLGYYPKQKFRAGDSATVWASLQGDDGAPDDLDVTVMSDAGPLTPTAIKIPKGEHIGQGKLVATYSGSVNVWFDSSKPSGSAPDSMFQIDFGPPIWALNLVPTLKTVNLFDSTDVEVELLDPQGEPVSTDAERQASLSFDKGSGALDSNPVTFQAKSSAVRTKFFPTSPGTIELRVISDGLPAATATVTVTVPYLLILLCAVGSALGGLVAFWTEQAATWHRLVIGLVSGFILYWAFVFGIIHWASSVHAYVINPFSAVALSCIGGWLGTKAITLVLKPLGLQL